MIDPNIQSELDKVQLHYCSEHMKDTIDALSTIPGAREAVANGLIRLVNAFPTDIDTLTKVTLLYDVLTSEITYNKKQLETHATPYTFLDGLYRNQGVCMGIAELFTVLAVGLGLACVHVVGYADATVANGAGLHTWNIVLLDDQQWYFLDPTFDLHKVGVPQHRWFLKCQKDMRGHHLDDQRLRGELDRWPGGVFPLAQCSWNAPLPRHPKTAELRQLFRSIRL